MNRPNRKFLMAWVGVALALCLAAPQGALAQATDDAPREAVTLVQAGTLLSVPGQAPRRHQTIVVRGRRIAGVVDGYVDDKSAGYAGARVVRLHEQFVMPGLMDMHVHLSVTPAADHPLAPGGESPQNTHTDDLKRLIDAEANARKTLLAGFTTVRDLGSVGSAVKVLREAIADGRVVGPRVKMAGPIIAVHAEPMNRTCSGPYECRRLVRELYDEGVDLIKVYVTCSGGKPCGGRTFPARFFPDELDAIQATAHALGLKVAGHAHGTAGINAALAAGFDSIEHASFNDAESRRLAIRSGAYFVPTISVDAKIEQELPGADAAMQPLMHDFIAEHSANLMKAYREGVRIAMGTDAGVVPHGDNAKELEAYVHLGMTPMDALRTATVNAADLLGMGKDLGTIEAGKFADIVAFQGDPLQRIEALGEVAFVMKEGQVYRLPEAKPIEGTAS